MELVIAVYRLSQRFPKSETYALANQMQRASVSIPSNIAEGFGVQQTKPYLRHLAIASGSLSELETQIEISIRLGYVSDEDKTITKQAEEVGRLLSGLRRSLNSQLETDSN
jgi:four helix bundle protein